MKGPWLSGEKINLRPLRNADAPRRAQWLNDTETVRLFTGVFPLRQYEYGEAIRWRYTMESDPATMVWAIETKNHRHIGDVDVHAINRFLGSARLTILVGDKAYWGDGYGTDAIKTLLLYVFGELELETVNLRVYDFNHRAIRCYEKCGFERIEPASSGSLPWGDSPRSNEILMTITRDRYFAERPNATPLYAQSR